MLQPFQTSLVICPSVGCCCGGPVVGDLVLRVLAGEVETALHHQERWPYIAVASDTANRCRPFSIAWLNGLWFADPIGARNHHPRPYHAHYKAGLVEVVEVAIEDAVFRTHVGH